jgi:hypothetical protein
MQRWAPWDAHMQPRNLRSLWIEVDWSPLEGTKKKEEEEEAEEKEKVSIRRTSEHGKKRKRED